MAIVIIREVDLVAPKAIAKMEPRGRGWRRRLWIAAPLLLAVFWTRRVGRDFTLREGAPVQEVACKARNRPVPSNLRSPTLPKANILAFCMQNVKTACAEMEPRGRGWRRRLSRGGTRPCPHASSIALGATNFTTQILYYYCHYYFYYDCDYYYDFYWFDPIV